MAKYKSYISDKEEIYEHIGTANDLIIYSLCGITNPDPTYEIIRKQSECYSIEYIIEGEGVIQENKDMYKVSQGDIFILHPWEYHHYYSSPKNPWKKIWVYITNGGYYMTTLLKLYNMEHRTLFQSIGSPLNLYEIFDLYKNNSPDFSRQLELKLHEFVIALSDKSKKLTAVKSDMELAKSYIDQNIGSHITVEDVSRYIKMSYSYFSRAFKKTFDISPAQYIMREKMTLAKHLLGSTDIPIPTISDHLCFSDLAHFSHTFQKHCGISPSAYRQRAIQERNISQDEWHKHI